MKAHLKDFKLWIICLDKKTYEILYDLDIQEIKLVELCEIETEELKAVKSQRKMHEYYWTLTPFVPEYVLVNNSEIERICYLDADMWLTSSLEEFFSQLEFEEASVLITKHAYYPKYDASRFAGIYCVQCIIFTRDALAEVLENWKKDCLEWCFDYYENGKFGDQKYLEKWPQKYQGVSVLKQQELILAPWNFNRFPYSDAKIIHFHGFKIKKYKRNTMYYTMADYPIPEVVEKHIYKSYAKEIKDMLNLLQKYKYELKQERLFYGYTLHFYREIRRQLKRLRRALQVSRKI